MCSAADRPAGAAEGAGAPCPTRSPTSRTTCPTATSTASTSSTGAERRAAGPLAAGRAEWRRDRAPVCGNAGGDWTGPETVSGTAPREHHVAVRARSPRRRARGRLELRARNRERERERVSSRRRPGSGTGGLARGGFPADDVPVLGDLAADGQGDALTAWRDDNGVSDRRLRRRRAALQRASRSPPAAAPASRCRSPRPPTTTGRRRRRSRGCFGDGGRRGGRVGLPHLRRGRAPTRDRERHRRRVGNVAEQRGTDRRGGQPAAAPTRRHHRRSTRTASSTAATPTTAPSGRRRSRPSTPPSSPARSS